MCCVWKSILNLCTWKVNLLGCALTSHFTTNKQLIYGGPCTYSFTIVVTEDIQGHKGIFNSMNDSLLQDDDLFG